MKKTLKYAILISAIVFSLCVFLLLGGSIIAYKAIAEEQPNSNLSYLQTMKMIVAQNFEDDFTGNVKDSFLQEDYHHVSIYYEKDFTELLPITKETLELAFAKTEVLFGKIKQEPIDFLVFESIEEMNNLPGSVNDTAFYSESDKMFAINYVDKELLMERDKYSLYLFQGVILHEYTHYAFARKAKEPSIYPLWFQEGLSVYVEDEGQGTLLLESKHIPFDQLTTNEQWQEARHLVSTNNYAQSYYAIDFLINKYGENVISDLMDSANETKDFGKSFKKVTGITISELDRAYLKAYKN